MRRGTLLCGLAAVMATFGSGFSSAAAPAPTASPPDKGPAITRQQIQNDWLLQDTLRVMDRVQASVASRADDAAGGCDGVKDGKWGFHTENEKQPWWQVDLQRPAVLDRLLLYNRCDAAQRNSRLLVLLSGDGKTWRLVYQHNGTPFYGFTDKKPLVVKLERGQGPLGSAATARQRLSAPG